MFYIFLFILLMVLNCLVEIIIIGFTNSTGIMLACVLAVDSAIIVYCIRQYIKEQLVDIIENKKN